MSLTSDIPVRAQIPGCEETFSLLPQEDAPPFPGWLEF